MYVLSDSTSCLHLPEMLRITPSYTVWLSGQRYCAADFLTSIQKSRTLSGVEYSERRLSFRIDLTSFLVGPFRSPKSCLPSVFLSSLSLYRPDVSRSTHEELSKRSLPPFNQWGGAELEVEGIQKDDGRHSEEKEGKADLKGGGPDIWELPTWAEERIESVEVRVDVNKGEDEGNEDKVDEVEVDGVEVDEIEIDMVEVDEVEVEVDEVGAGRVEVEWVKVEVVKVEVDEVEVDRVEVDEVKVEVDEVEVDRVEVDRVEVDGVKVEVVLVVVVVIVVVRVRLGVVARVGI